MNFRIQESPTSGKIFRLFVTEFQGKVYLTVHLNEDIIIPRQEISDSPFDFSLPQNSKGKKLTVSFEDEVENKVKSWTIES